MAGELAEYGGYSREDVELVKKLVCTDANDNELRLFLGQCKRTGLDPFAKQIYGIKRGGKLVIQTSIDGFRLIAERTREADGQDGPYWCGEDGVWRDVWLDAKPPAAAKVVVYRKGQSRGYTGVARFAEYSQGQGLWNKLPSTMLAKCAESLALRKAFPQELSGLYTSDEMGQADNGTDHHAEPAPERPALAAPKANGSAAPANDLAFPPQRAAAGHTQPNGTPKAEPKPPATLAELAAMLSSAPAPAAGTQLRDMVARVGQRMVVLSTAFAANDLAECYVTAMGLGDEQEWGWASLTRDQVAAGWGAVVRYVQAEAKAATGPATLPGMAPQASGMPVH